MGSCVGVASTGPMGLQGFQIRGPYHGVIGSALDIRLLIELLHDYLYQQYTKALGTMVVEYV